MHPVDLGLEDSATGSRTARVVRVHLEIYHPHPMYSSVLTIGAGGEVCERVFDLYDGEMWTIRTFVLRPEELDKLVAPFHKNDPREYAVTSIDRYDHYQSLLRIDTDRHDVHEWRYAERRDSAIQAFVNGVGELRHQMREMGRPGVQTRRQPVVGEIRLSPRPEGEGLEPCLLPESEDGLR